LTAVSSHEIAEAITDPDVNYKTLGWYETQRGEIGRHHGEQIAQLGGYTVQPWRTSRTWPSR